MRISQALRSIGFGGLGVSVRGTTKYHLSPMEQRAFAGALATGIGVLTNNHIKGFPNLSLNSKKIFSIFIICNSWCRYPQYSLENPQLLLHCGPNFRCLLPDLWLRREGARQVHHVWHHSTHISNAFISQAPEEAAWAVWPRGLGGGDGSHGR